MSSCNILGMKKTIAIILLTTVAKIGFCCSCIQMNEFSIKTEFNDRDVIFNGELIQVDTINVETDIDINISYFQYKYRYYIQHQQY